MYKLQLSLVSTNQEQSESLVPLPLAPPPLLYYSHGVAPRNGVRLHYYPFIVMLAIRCWPCSSISALWPRALSLAGLRDGSATSTKFGPNNKLDPGQSTQEREDGGQDQNTLESSRTAIIANDRSTGINPGHAWIGADDNPGCEVVQGP
jgi:hypothetical protein